MTALIEATEISVIRNKKRILDKVSLAIAPRDFVTIIGPNGAGKTMLLKTMLGFFAPDSGAVQSRQPLRIGYMPQKIVPDAILPLNVRGFLGLRHTASADKIAQIAAETDCTALLNTQLHALSGGEMQRVLLARALINDPELLVLDEPAQNLDVTGQLAFYKKIEEIYAARDIAILMVSHDLHLVMASTQKVVCLFHHICCSGAPQTVTRDPEFIALFGDDMARMMAVYPHDHDHNHDHAHKAENKNG